MLVQRVCLPGKSGRSRQTAFACEPFDGGLTAVDADRSPLAFGVVGRLSLQAIRTGATHGDPGMSPRHHQPWLRQIPLDQRDAVRRVDVQHDDPDTAGPKRLEHRTVPLAPRIGVESVVEDHRVASRLAVRRIAIDRASATSEMPGHFTTTTRCLAGCDRPASELMGNSRRTPACTTLR